MQLTSTIGRLAGTKWGAHVLQTSTTSLAFAPVEYCSPVWCRNAHTYRLDAANLPVDKTLILGCDFNCREIDRVRLTSNGPSHCHKLLDICNDFSLIQMNDKPTRLVSILELHLTNNPSLVRNCSIAPGFSDHDGMIVTDTDIQHVFNKSPPRKVPLYKSAAGT